MNQILFLFLYFFTLCEKLLDIVTQNASELMLLGTFEKVLLIIIGKVVKW